MHADACYHIGRSHAACQDYAIAGQLTDGRHYGVVADGCSSSLASDVGARVLAHAAVAELAGAQLSAQAVLGRARVAAHELGLRRDSLDATLLVVCGDRHRLDLWIAGDGMVLARRRDGRVECWVHDQSNAPGYLSYTLDPMRLEAYLSTGRSRSVDHFIDGRHAGNTRTALTVPAGSDWAGFLHPMSLQPSEYAAVVIASDGVGSFLGDAIGGDEPIRVTRIGAELLAIRSSAGAFLQRRLRRVLKDSARRGWSHHDDLAVAGIWCDAEVAP